MNTGQTMLTIGALTLLGYTILATNRSSLTHGIILQQTEIGVYMISLAISRVEEATGKAFDQYTVGDIINSTSNLTTNDLLGTESGEVYPEFNDFDDYHNFTKVDTVPGVDVLRVKSVVSYINSANPDSPANVRTFHKKMDVIVTGHSTSDTLRMSYIFSYWAFR